MRNAGAVCVFFLLIATSIDAAITQFKWTDCASSDPNRALQIQEITATPMPLVTPGPLVLHIKGKIAKDLTKWSLKLDIRRHTFAGSVLIPCTHDFGSCTFDGCKVLSEMTNQQNQGISTLANQVQKMLTQNNIDITCPVKSQPVSVDTFTITVPELGAVADVLADGDYTVDVRALNPDSGELFGCITFDAAIKRKCTGWLCHRKR
ncbi:hypothetical protein SNE40_012386 [Patella caerulea]|uniref:MD-2-related lipid-recognition domain-containing protein n=1 Tax=Patella caerulea TaxID=87958 RepID=A0AAN8PMD4_PATCE